VHVRVHKSETLVSRVVAAIPFTEHSIARTFVAIPIMMPWCKKSGDEIQMTKSCKASTGNYQELMSAARHKEAPLPNNYR